MGALFSAALLLGCANAVAGAVADTTPPAEVTNLVASAGDSSITVRWSEPADSDFAKVEISSSGSVIATIAKGTMTATASNLTNGTTYTFTVKTVDASGNKSTGLTVSATPGPSSYRILYDGNGNTGGTVPVDDSLYPSGSVVTVLGNTGNLVKDGDTFIGWSTDSSTAGIAYGAGATITVGSANITLYAVWSGSSSAIYSVTYIGNGNSGGTVPVDSGLYSPGSQVTALGNTGNLVRDGYTFAGWNTSGIGEGTTYTAGSTFLVGTSDVVLYAQWIANAFSVAYDGNGGTGGSVPTDSGTYEASSLVTVQGNTGSLVRTGYNFAGWNTQADCLGTSYVEGDTLSLSSSVTLHAVWIPENLQFSINADKLPGMITITGYTVKPAGTLVIPAGVEAIEYYAFSYCTGITALSIPSTVSTISMGAFMSCSSLESVTLPSSVTEVAESTFKDCYGLTSVSLPSTLTLVGKSAFQNCSSLTSITIPDSVTILVGTIISGFLRF